jgi:PIN domain-containing protein
MMRDRRVRWPLTPLPGVTRELLFKNLQEVHRLAVNARGWTPGNAHRTYLDWANTAIELLNTLVSPNDLERLVLTRRYWTLQAATIPETDLINHLVNVEFGERLRVIHQAALELRELIRRWSQPGIFAVADTSFYIHGPKKLDEVDLAEVVGSHTLPIHLIVPIIVVDELDRLKRSGARDVRGRAQVTLAVLDDRIGDVAEHGVLHPADHSALDKRTGDPITEEVTLEILFDPIGHTRLPIPDDEVVDRVVSVQALAGRPVRFVTCDTNQSFRARFAGLESLKIKPRSP